MRSTCEKCDANWSTTFDVWRKIRHKDSIDEVWTVLLKKCPFVGGELNLLDFIGKPPCQECQIVQNFFTLLSEFTLLYRPTDLCVIQILDAEPIV